MRDTGPGHRPRRPGAHLRGVPAGARHQRRAPGRHRPRPRPVQEPGRAARRPHLGRERAGRGLDLHLHPARGSETVSERHRPDGYYESLLERSPSAIAIVDMDDVVTSWNPAAERLFGYSRDEAMGRKIDSLVASRPDLHSEAVEVGSRARAGEDVHVVTRRTRKDGTLVDVDVVGCAIFVDGQAGRVLRDLHRHRRAAAAEALLRGALRFEPDRDRCHRHERNRYRRGIPPPSASSATRAPRRFAGTSMTWSPRIPTFIARPRSARRSRPEAGSPVES